MPDLPQSRKLAVYGRSRFLSLPRLREKTTQSERSTQIHHLAHVDASTCTVMPWC
jgi:hypothetical protein